MHIEIHPNKEGGYTVKIAKRDFTAQIPNKDVDMHVTGSLSMTDTLIWLMNSGWMHKLHGRDPIYPEDS